MVKLTRGERFKDARTVHNSHGSETMNIVQAATGVSASLIADLENDEKNRRVNFIDVAKLAQHYGVTTDWLCGLCEDHSIHPCAANELGLSDGNVGFLSCCVQLSAADPESTDPVDIAVSLASLHFVNNLVEIVGNDPQLVADFISMTPACKRGRKRGADPACTPTAGTVYQNNMEVITHSDFVRFKAREVGRAVEQHLLEMYHYGND